jgi:GAF domain-containing protein
MRPVSTPQLVGAFVDLADTLVGDFDTADTLQLLVERCVEVLNAAAAAVLLTNGKDELRLLASSSEEAQLLELYQLQCEEGPCLDAYRTGQPVHCHDLVGMETRWPNFTPATLSLGFRSVHALPMRLRGNVIGGLNLFDAGADDLDERQHLPIGQALADIATIAVVKNRSVRDSETLSAQLQTALDTRVVIEQAKGIIAATLEVGLDEAFTILRAHARRTRQPLSELAHNVARGHIDAQALSDLHRA